MKDLQSLAQIKWECKYHIVWVPKYRRKIFFYEKIRKRLGEIGLFCVHIGLLPSAKTN